jgi:hypothetical protein
MNSSTLQHITSFKQDAQDGKFTMQGLALTSLLHNLIRDYGKYRHGSFSVDIDNFDIVDKRLILSHIMDATEYQYACQSVINTQVIFDESRKFIQRLIDDDCDEVFKEDMESRRSGI